MNDLARKIFVIGDKHSGQRVDNYLFTQCKGVPKSRIYRAIRKGEVRVNKKRVRAFYKLQEHDQLRVPPIRISKKADLGSANSRTIASLTKRIIYQDPGLIVINKPPRMAAHGGSGINFGVIETLRSMFREQESLELVHRLDRNTSGCLMVAKKRSYLRYLHEALRDNKIYKSYLLLVKGDWPDGAETVDLPLHKYALQSGERMVRVSDQGKEAITQFKVMKKLSNTTLIQATPQTGRTHQIRVHAAKMGHPIAGDEKYGDKDFNCQMANLGLSRLFLHAHALKFTLPGDDTLITVTAKLDDELRGVIRYLRP